VLHTTTLFFSLASELFGANWRALSEETSALHPAFYS